MNERIADRLQRALAQLLRELAAEGIDPQTVNAAFVVRLEAGEIHIKDAAEVIKPKNKA